MNKLNILIFYFLCGLIILSSQSAKAQGTTCATATALTSGTAVTSQTLTDTAGGSGGDCGSADSATGSSTAGCTYGWYSITAAAAQTIEVALNATSGATQDARVEIYSGTCAALVLEDCDRQTNTSDALASYIAPSSGTYYIRVTDFQCNANVTYEIKATLTDAPCNATTLTSGTAVTGETITDVTAVSGTVGIGNGGDCAASSDNDDYVTPLTDIAATVGCGYKWYSITAATAQTIEVALDVTSGGGTQDVRADLYSGSSCGNLTRITCDRNTDNALLSYIAPTSGTYYIRVTDFACNANITYNIKATLTDAICNATPLSVGTTSGLSLTDVTAVSGTVGEGSGGICATADYNNPPTGIVGCGYKWYTFSAAANSPIELYLNTATGARLELYSGSTCTSFVPRDCASGTNPAVTYTSATATTYWARVTDTNCDANLSFSLQLNIIQNVLATTGTQTINMDCGTTYNFYDSGGPGGDGAGLYANSLNSNVTFVAPAGQSVRVTFKNVWQGNIGYCATGNGYNAIRIDNGQTGACSIADYLTIYDGAIGSNNLGVYTGTTAFYPSPGTIVSSGNSLSFNFISGASGQEEGWEAVVECVSDISENPTDVTIDCGLGTVFTDNAFNAGGSTNIQPNDQYVVTYCPGTPGYCAFVGSLSGTATLNLNDNSDVLYVYNSDQATGSPIAVLTGGDPNVSNGVACGGAAANSNTITGITAFLANNPNGCLTFKFVSSNSTKDPSWAPRSGWSLPIECVECDLGNGGGTEVGTATSITSNGFWAGTSINDTGNSDSGANTGCNDAGTDFVLNSTGCLESEITRLENTIWYKLVTPAAMCLANDPILQVNYVNCQNYSSSGSGTNAGNGIQFVLWEMTPGAGNINFTGEGDLWDNNNNGTAVGNNNMIYCEDKVTAGEFVDVPCLKPNTTYYIMVDGFTGQHCFFDMYIDVFPADLTAAPVLSPASGICSGGTFDITQTAKREVEFVWSLTNLTDRNQIYNLSGGSQSLGVGYTSDGVTYTYNDASLPVNTGCTPVTYYIYAIDANFPESAGFCGTDYQSAACRPYQMTPIVVYPTPPISNIVTDCSFNIDPNCGAANSNFVVEYSADGVTNWQAESATVPPTPSPSNSFGYWARVRHTSSPSDCGTPVQVFGVGCATTCTIIPPTVFSNSPICAGQTLNLNASTIASATGYSWSGPNGFTSSVQNPSISNATTAATGTYTVTVTNSAIAGCTATATLSVIVNPTPTVSALSIAAICPGTTPAVLSYTASIAGILTVSSGTATINTQTFTVASGAGTVNIAVPTTITNGQTVSVTLTANGCTSTAQTVAIPVHSAPDANFPIPASVCQGSAMSFDGSTSTAGAGTISNYTWIWGDGSANTSSATATTTHTFPASGTYNVSLQITTSNGCVNTETQTVTVVPNPTISNITVTQPTCALATGGVSFNVPTPVTDYEYQIDGGAFTAVAANPTTISSLAVGAHTVTVRRIATPQCTASISFTLVAATGCGATCTAPGMTLTNTSAAFCQSSTTQTASYQYTALANGSTGTPNRYDLTQVFGTTIAGATVTNQTLAAPTSNISISVPANTAAGTYTFVLKIYNSSDPTCAAQYPLQLIINPAPTVTLSNNGPVCQGISVTLTASGGTSYSWTGPSGTIAGTTNTQTITPAVAGTYTVVATDANGCTNSATTTVIVNPLPTAAITGTNSICAGSSSIFTATPNGATYAWNTSDATQSIVVTTAGTYTVTVTNSNNCSNVATRTLTVLTAPDANFTTNSPQCQGAAINFDGSLSTAGSGTITAYSWNFGDGTTGTGSTSTHNYGASAVGTYQVSLTITTSNGCTNVQTGTVVINPTPIASITGTTTVCQIGTGTPTTTTITANGGATYDWSNIVGTDDGATNAGVGAGTYTVTVTSAAGCSSTAAITVTSTDCTGAANCIVDAGPDPANFCVGTSSSVNLNATPAASGSSGTWTCLGCPATPTFGSATSAATTASGLTATGTYTFVWTVTGATCNGQDNAVVTVYPTPVAPVTSGSTYCQGQTITAITATGQTGATFTWYSDVALNSVIDNDATYTPIGAGIVYVTQTLNGCQSPATAVTTTVNPNPTPSFTTDSPACLGEAIVFTNTTTGATSYLWAFGDGTNSTQTSPSHTYTSAGTYTVTITSTSANGCVASTTGSVVV
ncbi:MAG: PKD domain-containing protein, partial [Chitinophagales bacterium]|nr:PKD domain-containing protein [Chitinophagales bacterium]